ncbi:MAG: hypothetical protein ACRC4T_21965 [Cetobacterium sp.]
MSKKMLFIGPNDFDYYQKIQKKIEEEKIIVDYYDEKPSITYTKIGKILRNFFPKIFNRRKERYFNNIKKKNYDIIFIIRGEYLNKKIIVNLKLNNPRAKLIMYQWDSLNSLPNLNECIHLFDKVYSFDRKDCDENKHFIFKPLFYTSEYSENIEKQKIKYKYIFIGSHHSDRFELLSKIKKSLKIKEDESMFYLYRPLVSFLYYKYVLKKGIGNAKIKDIKIKPLSIEKVAQYIKSSEIIIDCQHPQQTGLTMRTIEALGAKKKIITTNTNLYYYDFYNPNNIFIIDRNKDIFIPQSFSEGRYEDIPEKIYEKYSLDSWVKSFGFSSL